VEVHRVEKIWKNSRMPPSLVLPVALYGAVEAGWQLAPERGVGVVTAAVALVAAAVVGIAWLLRARAADRRDAVLNAYAEREIDRDRRRELDRRRRVLARIASGGPEKRDT
jgi:hypothetical protein